MSRDELAKILAEIEIQYSFFEATEALESKWYEVMHCFSYEDVKKNLEIAMSDRQFQKEPPTAYYLIQGLTPVRKKLNFNECYIYCSRCHRPIAQKDEEKHLTRCNSVYYIKKQYKKWYGIELDNTKIKELYQMDDEEFDERYDKLLKHIYENTNNKNEKMIIGFIFNPPSQEQAKRYLGIR